MLTIYLSTLVLLSLASFVLYGWDKRQAKLQRSRIPEQFLHWLALLGGWPGALIGQRVFRHKTQKLRFRLVFWGCVLAHCASVGIVTYLR